MFSLKLESTALIDILKVLQTRIGLFPFEVSDNGIDIATMDDGQNMAIWIHFPSEIMSVFEFNGEGVERYMIPSKTFIEAASVIKYPLEIGSLLDGSIKLNSSDGRKVFKIIPEEDNTPEEGVYHRNRFTTILEEESYYHIKILKQDLLEAVRSMGIASAQAKLNLENSALVFSAVDAVIEGEAIAPLIETIENPNWSHTYELKLLGFFLNIPNNNVEISMYLRHDSDTFLIDIPIGDNWICKIAIAAIPTRE